MKLVPLALVLAAASSLDSVSSASYNFSATKCTQAQVDTIPKAGDAAVQAACPSLYIQGPTAIDLSYPASLTTASPCKAPSCLEALTKFAAQIPNCVFFAGNIRAPSVIAHAFCEAFSKGDVSVAQAKAMVADFAKQLGQDDFADELGQNTTRTSRPPTAKTLTPMPSFSTPTAVVSDKTTAPEGGSNTTKAPESTGSPEPLAGSSTDITIDTAMPAPSAANANKTTSVPTTQPPKSDSNGRTATAIAVLTLALVVGSGL